MYAVIDFQGHQYQVSPGEEIVVDRLDQKEGASVEIDSVLLLVDGEKVSVGEPLVVGVKVVAKVLEHFKGKKIRVAKYRAKSRYRRVKGFRPQLTRLKIEKIIYDYGKDKG